MNSRSSSSTLTQLSKALDRDLVGDSRVDILWLTAEWTEVVFASELTLAAGRLGDLLRDLTDFRELEIKAVRSLLLSSNHEGADFCGSPLEESEDHAVVDGDLPDSFFVHGLFLLSLKLDLFGSEFDDFLFASPSFCHFFSSIQKLYLIKSHSLCQLSALQQ